MRLHAPTSILLGLAVLAACGGGDDASRDRERARLDALEQRLDAIDQRLAAIDKNLPTGERLRSDLQALAQRVRAVESKVAQAPATAKGAPPPAPAPAPRGKRNVAPAPARPDVAERREQLGALMTEYRHRLDVVRRQPGATPADQMAARRAVRDWYVAHRRAIISGQPQPD